MQIRFSGLDHLVFPNGDDLLEIFATKACEMAEADAISEGTYREDATNVVVNPFHVPSRSSIENISRSFASVIQAWGKSTPRLNLDKAQVYMHTMKNCYVLHVSDSDAMPGHTVVEPLEVG